MATRRHFEGRPAKQKSAAISAGMKDGAELSRREEGILVSYFRRVMKSDLHPSARGLVGTRSYPVDRAALWVEAWRQMRFAGHERLSWLRGTEPGDPTLRHWLRHTYPSVLVGLARVKSGTAGGRMCQWRVTADVKLFPGCTPADAQLWRAHVKTHQFRVVAKDVATARQAAEEELSRRVPIGVPDNVSIEIIVWPAPEGA